MRRIIAVPGSSIRAMIPTIRKGAAMMEKAMVMALMVWICLSSGGRISSSAAISPSWE